MFEKARQEDLVPKKGGGLWKFLHKNVGERIPVFTAMVDEHKKLPVRSQLRTATEKVTEVARSPRIFPSDKIPSVNADPHRDPSGSCSLRLSEPQCITSDVMADKVLGKKLLKSLFSEQTVLSEGSC